MPAALGAFPGVALRRPRRGQPWPHADCRVLADDPGDRRQMDQSFPTGISDQAVENVIATVVLKSYRQIVHGRHYFAGNTADRVSTSSSL